MAIKVVPNQKKSKFLHFLNAYICLDLGQAKKFFRSGILVIKSVALLRPVVLSYRDPQYLILIFETNYFDLLFCNFPLGLIFIEIYSKTAVQFFLRQTLQDIKKSFDEDGHLDVKTC